MSTGMRMRLAAGCAAGIGLAGLMALPANASTPNHATGSDAATATTASAVPVKGSLASVNGPTYVFSSKSGTAVPAATSSLPFNYILDDVSYGIESRRFTTSTKQVCTDLALHKVKGGTPQTTFGVKLYEDVFGTDPKIGATVAWPVDNTVSSYCWGGVSSGHTYYFWFGYGSGGNNVYVDGNGTAHG